MPNPEHRTRCHVAAACALALTTTLAGCGDGVSPTELLALAELPDDTFVGRLDGKPWRGQASAWWAGIGDGSGRFYITGISDAGPRSLVTHVISIHLPSYPGVGTYSLSGNAVHYQRILGDGPIQLTGSGDVSGTLVITEFAGATIAGTVEFTWAPADPMLLSSIMPVRFTDGRFRSTVPPAID